MGLALSSDVLASAVSAYTYGKHKNLDIKNGIVMMISVLCFTLVGSYISSLVPSHAMGGFSVFMTLLLGIKFIVRPVMTTKESMEAVSPKKRFIQSIFCGMLIGFICGFVGAGGGMMMLLILTSVLGAPDWWCMAFCILSTFLWARVAAKFANKTSPIILNRATGVVLSVLGISIIAVNYLA